MNAENLKNVETIEKSIKMMKNFVNYDQQVH